MIISQYIEENPFNSSIALVLLESEPFLFVRKSLPNLNLKPFLLLYKEIIRLKCVSTSGDCSTYLLIHQQYDICLSIIKISVIKVI